MTAEEYVLNPLTTLATAVADDAAGFGGYYTGLTRDDVGGLRYLLRTNNANYEILLPGVHGVGPNASDYVDLALRFGVNKITFVRREVDTFTGQFFTPYTNQFADYYSPPTHFAVRTQQLERVITTPDILFCAGNSGGLRHRHQCADHPHRHHQLVEDSSCSGRGRSGPHPSAHPVGIRQTQHNPCDVGFWKTINWASMATSTGGARLMAPPTIPSLTPKSPPPAI